MTIHKASRSKHRRGFTLTETLVVVGIIAILAGLAIPGILSARRNLHHMELDEAARSLYIAAQNRMSGLSASGELASFHGTPISQRPVDFPETGPSWDEGEYEYLSQSDSEIGILFLPGAIDATLNEGCFYVEYNKKTGMVYAAFYSDVPFAYATEPLDPIRRRENRDIGYYGGTDIALDVVEPLEPPDFIIVNENTLEVRFTNENDSYTYDLTISDGTNSFVYADVTSFETSSSHSNISNASNPCVVTLDSLESGKHFHELLPTFLPGADLTITLTVSADGWLPATSRPKTTNSLFASRSGHTATLSYGRHLQNLHPEVSSVEPEITAAVQGADMDWQDTGYSFVSISNSVLRSFSGNGKAIRHMDAPLFDTFVPAGEIKHTYLLDPIIISDSGNLGSLINTADNLTISGCRVYADSTPFSATLTSTGFPFHTGGLVGLATNCTIQNSFAALTSIQVDSGNVGGLVGNMEGGSIVDCYADTGYWDSAEAQWLDGSGIRTSANAAGGLVGGLYEGSIQSSYALGNIASGTGTLGGFVGLANSGSFTECYSATSFQGSSATAIYGFSSSYGAGNYFLKSTVPGTGASAPGASTHEELAAIFSGSSLWVSATATTTNAYGQLPVEGEADPVYPFPRLQNLMHYGDWPGEDEPPPIAKGFLYYEKYTDGGYGFYGRSTSALVDTLRLNAPIEEDGYVFVDDAEDAPSNIQVIPTLGNRTFSSLALTGEALASGGLEGKAYFMRPATLETIRESETWRVDENHYYRFQIEGQLEDTYYCNIYFAKTAGYGSTVPTASPSYEVRTARHLTELSDIYNVSGLETYHKLTYRQTTNIDFSTYKDFPGLKRMYPIGRQAQFMGTYNGNGHIITSLGMDFPAISHVGLFGYVNGGTIQNVRLMGIPGSDEGLIQGGKNVGALAGLIEGQSTVENCIVTGYDVTAVDYESCAGGLIGLANGTNQRVQNCQVLSSPSGTAGGIVSVTGGGFAGGLIGQSQTAPITGCSVIGINVEARDAGSGCAGGLVGLTRGNIKDSKAVASTSTISASTSPVSIEGDGAVGGLVGNVDENNRTIDNCFAAGFDISGEQVTGGFVGIMNHGTITKSASDHGYFGGEDSGPGGSIKSTGGSVGGFIGSGNATITNCYAAASFTSSSVPVSAFSGGDGSVTSSYALAKRSGQFITDFGGGTTTSCLAFNGSNGDDIRALNGLQGGSPGTARTYPYDPILGGSAYPFPAVVKNESGQFVHYGNWPGAELPDFLYLAYYEIYEISKNDYDIRFYSEELELNTLLPNQKIVQDGYAYLFRAKDKHANNPWGNSSIAMNQLTQDALNFKLIGKDKDGNYVKVPLKMNWTQLGEKQLFINNTEVGKIRTGNESYNNAKSNFTHDGKWFVPILLPLDGVTPDLLFAGTEVVYDGSYYVGLEVSGRGTGISVDDMTTFWLNPYVAQSEILRDAAPPNRPQKEMFIRTERQYASITYLMQTYPTLLNPFWNRPNYTFTQNQSLVFGNSNKYTTTYGQFRQVNFITQSQYSHYRNTTNPALSNVEHYTILSGYKIDGLQ